MVAKQDFDLHLTINEATQDFLLDLEIGNRAPGTISNYRDTVRELGQYAESHGWPPVAGISKVHLRQYMVDLKKRPRWHGLRDQGGRPLSDAYYETLYRRIKRFFNWCLVEGYAEHNPMSDIPRPKVEQRVIPIVSDQDFRRLLELTDPTACKTPYRKFLAVRNQAVLWLLKDSPGRKAELAELEVDDVDLRERRVLVRGKGRKERYMYLGAVTTRAMGRYRALRDHVAPADGAWWVDGQGQPMTKDWLYLFIKRLGARAGLKDLHPHRFRHTFSIAMIEADVPQPTLEVMGGWERLPKTYLATLGDKAAKAAHRRVSPADRLAGRKPADPGR